MAVVKQDKTSYLSPAQQFWSGYLTSIPVHCLLIFGIGQSAAAHRFRAADARPGNESDQV